MTTPSHREIKAAIDALGRKFDELSDRIGEEQVLPDGKIVGTGLTGRIIRTEAKVLAYDRLKERAIGAFAAASVAIGIIWWLTREKIAALFGVNS